jgi:hypothetical protein
VHSSFVVLRLNLTGMNIAQNAPRAFFARRILRLFEKVFFYA